MPLGEEGMGDHGLYDEDHCADHLGDGLYLAQDGCRNNDAALSCYYQAKAGYRKLAEKDNENYPYEDEGLGGLASEDHPDEDGYHRGKHHEFIGKGVDELAKVGDQIILSCYLAVKHIGEGGEAVDDGGNDVTPYGNISHKEEGCNEDWHKTASYKREGVRNVK